MIQSTTKKHWHWFLVVFIVSHILILFFTFLMKLKRNQFLIIALSEGGKNLFLRNFVNENIDNQFDFSVNYEKGKLVIIIDKESMNDTSFEELIKLMYLHTLM